jgi:ribosomal protein L21E
MVRRKKIRTRGKLKLSEYFKKLKEGEKVSIVREMSVSASFPPRMQGRTGVVKEARGKSYVIEAKDQNKKKEFIIAPIHLKKIKEIKSNDKRE